MSQFFINSSSSAPPPTVPTSFVTDNGTAIPAANVLNVNGDVVGGSGIVTSANPNLSNNLLIAIKNSNTATTQTVGAVTADIITIPLSTTPTTYVFEARVAAFEPTTPASAGFSLFCTIRSGAVSATLITDTDKINHRESALNLCDANFVVSSDNAILRVTGVAGLTIDWAAFSVYVSRS